MFLRIFLNSCPLNLLLVQSHQEKIINVKRLIQGRNKVTRVRVKPRSCDQNRRKNDAFALSATLTNKMNVRKKKIRKRENTVVKNLISTHRN